MTGTVLIGGGGIAVVVVVVALVFGWILWRNRRRSGQRFDDYYTPEPGESYYDYEEDEYPDHSDDYYEKDDLDDWD